MFIFNYCVALTVSASSLFPVAIAIKNFGSAYMIPQTVIAVLITAILIFRHRDNIERSFRKEELTAMEFLKKLFGKHKGMLVEEDEEAKQER